MVLTKWRRLGGQLISRGLRGVSATTEILVQDPVGRSMMGHPLTKSVDVVFQEDRVQWYRPLIAADYGYALCSARQSGPAMTCRVGVC